MIPLVFLDSSGTKRFSNPVLKQLILTCAICHPCKLLPLYYSVSCNLGGISWTFKDHLPGLHSDPYMYTLYHSTYNALYV